MSDEEKSQDISAQSSAFDLVEEEPEIFKTLLNSEEMELYKRLGKSTIQDYKEVFDIFDESGDGTISNDEITKVMRGLGENP